ncbi:MAG: hypothetical protein RSC10_02215 [Longicatena sp.]
MVQVENICIDHHDFIGVYLNLPQYPIHFIMSTRSILAQNNFAKDYFEHFEKKVAVILCEYTFGFEGLLASGVMECNEIAKAKGVKRGMCAKEALILCENNKD